MSNLTRRFARYAAWTILAVPCASMMTGQAPAPGLITPEDAGRRAFESRCAHCHGVDATGGEGPNIVAQVAARNDAELIRFLREGRPAKGMPAFPVTVISNPEMTVLIAHLRRITQTAAATIPHN